MKRKGDFILRDIAGEHILVPTGQSAMEINGLITIDEMGLFIWNHLSHETSKEIILSAILQTYEVDEETARADLEEFLLKLKEANLIELNQNDAV